MDLSNNQFQCPLPVWCSSAGSGVCEPCFVVYSEPSSGSSLSLDSNITKTQSSDPNTFNYFGVLLLGIIVVLFILLLILVFILFIVFRTYKNRKFLPLDLADDNEDL